MPQNVQQRDVTSYQFFLPELHAIKIVVVVYSLLAHNIDFFKRIFSLTFSKTFLLNVTRDLILRQDCLQSSISK